LEITTGGEARPSRVLKDIFDSAVNSVSSLSLQSQLIADTLFHAYENILDLAAFSPTMVSTLFDFQIEDASCPQAACLKVLHDAGNFGFQGLSDPNLAHETIFQVRFNNSSLYHVSET
jgi:hypothetical protein